MLGRYIKLCGYREFMDSSSYFIELAFNIAICLRQGEIQIG